MLLSSVAESVYWFARYAERAEATARLVKVHTELFLDLPWAAGLRWRPLLEVTGSGASFDCSDHNSADPNSTGQNDTGQNDTGQNDTGQNDTEKYDTKKYGGLARAAGPGIEEEVVHYLLAETTSAASVRSCIRAARNNLVANRPVLPRAAFEVVNRLHSWSSINAGRAANRVTRLNWCAHVIEQLQMLNGLLSGTMNRDEAYAFLEIGRHLERADMTTRVLDVQAAALLERARAGDPFVDVTWMGVLRSLNAEHTHRQKLGGGVSAATALPFLLRDTQLPASVEYCLVALSRALLELPQYDAPMATAAALQRHLSELALPDMSADNATLHRELDRMQAGLATVHDGVAASYFQLPRRDASALAVTGAQPSTRITSTDTDSSVVEPGLCMTPVSGATSS